MASLRVVWDWSRQKSSKQSIMSRIRYTHQRQIIVITHFVMCVLDVSIHDGALLATAWHCGCSRRIVVHMHGRIRGHCRRKGGSLEAKLCCAYRKRLYGWWGKYNEWEVGHKNGGSLLVWDQICKSSKPALNFQITQMLTSGYGFDATLVHNLQHFV